MEETYSFTAMYWAIIENRGRIAYIAADSLPEGIWTPELLTNLEVLIDGTQYRVNSVEMFPIEDVSPENPYTLPFGIIVTQGFTSLRTSSE